MTGTIDDLVRYVFTRPYNTPLSPNSVQALPEGIGQNVSELFEFLLMFYTKGMKVKFGNTHGQVELNALSFNDITEFCTFFQAIGFTPTVYCFHTSQIQKMYQQTSQSQHSSVTVSLAGVPNDNTTTIDPFKYPHVPTPDMMINYKNVNSDKLADYKFQLRCRDDIYVISFAPYTVSNN